MDVSQLMPNHAMLVAEDKPHLNAITNHFHRTLTCAVIVIKGGEKVDMELNW